MVYEARLSLYLSLKHAIKRINTKCLCGFVDKVGANNESRNSLLQKTFFWYEIKSLGLFQSDKYFAHE